MDVAAAMIRPGVTTDEIDRAVHEVRDVVAVHEVMYVIAVHEVRDVIAVLR